jgi:uncharacterized membrane protein
VYGLLGWPVEVCFTAARDYITGAGDKRLRGESYIWMAPVYGVGGLAGELTARALTRRPLWQRAVGYALTFWTVEAVSGETLRRLLGDVPWGEEYRTHPDNVGNGLIRLSYAPYWAVAGLALERATPVIKRIRLSSS